MTTENKLFIGIDPGKSGAIVGLTEDGAVVFVRVSPLIGAEYDLQEVRSIFEEYADCTTHACLEDVHAVQGVQIGASSNFNFGQGKMLWHMSLVVYDIPYTLIQPKAWQKEVWTGVTIQYKSGSSKKTKDTKATSLLAAKRLFPTVDLRNPDRKTDRAKKPHDGVVDALLIAEYCRRKHK